MLDRRTFARTVAWLVAGAGAIAAGLAGFLRPGRAGGRNLSDASAGAPARATAGVAGREGSPQAPMGRVLRSPSPLPTRRLGRTDLEVPILSTGGHHVGRASSEREARHLVAAALEEGVRFFDTAESYQRGKSERWLGAALREVRSEVLLMTKTHSPGDRSAESARRHLEGSLERLGTDYLDLWQLHSIKSAADVDRAFRPGGAMEYIMEARDEGLVRFVGVTGHITPEAHRRALHHWDAGWRFDTVQFPLNPIDWHQQSFERGVLTEVVARDIGVIAMKTSADGALLRAGICTIAECLRYVWSLPVSVAVVGMETPEIVRHNARLARELTPMTETERTALRNRIASRATLQLEWYKRERGG